MMKKMFLMLMLLMISVSLSSISLTQDPLYDMVVPMRYDSLRASGGLWSDDLLRLNIPFDGGNTVFEFGIEGNYQYRMQDETETMRLIAEASIDYENTFSNSYDFNFQISASEAYYTSYSLELAGLPGFYEISLSGTSLDISSTTAAAFTLGIDLPVSAYFGVGRLYWINPVLEAQLLAKHLGAPADRETIRKTAEILHLENQKLNPMTDNHAEVRLQYYQDLADALGIGDRVSEVILITHSQEFAFESERYSGLSYGWEAKAGLFANMETVLTAPSFDIDVGPQVRAQFAGFLMDTMLHYLATGTLTAGYDTNTENFRIILEGSADFRYFPGDWRWYVDGTPEITIGYDDGFEFDLDAAVRANYMINPNFTVFAGTSLGFSRFNINTGGSIRIW